MDDLKCWPVFLIGCQRSGSTLVRYLLDAHPRLACPPESKFIAGVESLLMYPQALRGLRSLGFSNEQVIDIIGSMVKSFFEEYARKQGKHRWIDKTPNYYRLLPLIDAMLKRKVLYLFIVRDPLDCIDSLERAEYFTPERLEDPDIARALQKYGRGREGWARYWMEVAEHLVTFASHNSERCHVFRYEDLVDSPQTVLASLLDFLGETMPDDLVQRAFTASHTDGYQDWKIKETSSIHRASLEKWRHWRQEDVCQIWNLVESMASRFGYGPPSFPSLRLGNIT